MPSSRLAFILVELLVIAIIAVLRLAGWFVAESR